MSITDDLRMAMARVWDEWADLHGVAAPAHIVGAWLSVTIAADALDSEVAALTAQRDAAQALVAQWTDLRRTEAAIMTTPQSNAYRSCIFELRVALGEDIDTVRSDMFGPSSAASPVAEEQR